MAFGSVNVPASTDYLPLTGGTVRGDLTVEGMIDGNLNQNLLAQIMLLAHPIGSFYQSTIPTSPSQLFGGAWERVTGQFLFAADESHPAGSTGGEENHASTIDEMAAHTHSLRINWTNEFYNKGVLVDGNGSPIGSSDAVQGHVSVDQYQTTSYAGKGQPHNNMPPYLSVYTWYRVK